MNSNASSRERCAMNKIKLTVNSTNKPESLPQLPGDSSGSPVSTNTKANGEKNELAARADKSGQVPTPGRVVADFFLKLAKQKTPGRDDLDRLRSLIVSTPDAWELATIPVMSSVRRTIIAKMGDGVTGALVLAELDIQAKQLDYDASPPLERMLIDHILTARLRLIHVESCYNNALSGGSIGIEAGRFWQDFLESAQSQFLRASEMLAKIRRLARNTPALQINIAREGGKQVNVQG